MVKYDFHGWATRNDLKCSDGRVIRRDAFKNCDGKIVPLVWNHRHDDPSNVLGHALLKNQEDGVYAYCTFNESEAGKAAKLLVEHGDISALSIFANQLKQEGSNVLHGDIKEVSLVLAGANPGASICNVVRHGEMVEDEADIYTGEDFILEHNSMNDFTEEQLAALKGPKGPKGDIGPKGPKDDSLKEEDKMANNEETVRDVFETLTEKQKTVVYALIGQALEDAQDNDEEDGGENMKHNVFDNVDPETTMIHADDMQAILADARRTGSMREAVENFAQDRGCDSNSLFHADYGIENVGYLFPDDRSVTNEPIFVSRNMDWVSKLMNNIRHTPFSRIKSLFANITEDDARAKGYIKGNLKKEEVFTLLKRSTSPTTVYKKQKMDRDDVVDIVDLDVVAWIKKEMRIMLDEELARAILVGDGRVSSSDDKIDPIHIRPIWTDDDFYTIKQTVSVASSDLSLIHI